METRTVEQVESWQTRPFADGFAGLRELSDGEFSGAVRAGGAWLFMLNGRIIGVYEGSLDDFEDADGTAYAAPHPSLPLLFSMQEKGGQTQAKYYTNDTPLSEVDSTLTDGKFTGYVELSENVLSGDYYVAYYGGRSMSVAFVGASEQVLTGEEAFERAADEVGIYEVRDVDIEVLDVPEPDEPDDSSATESDGPTDGGRATAGDGRATADPSSDDRTPSGATTDGQSAGGSAGGGSATDRSPAQPTGDRPSAGQSASGRATAGRSSSDAGERSPASERNSGQSPTPERDGRASDAGTAGPTGEAGSTGEANATTGASSASEARSAGEATPATEARSAGEATPATETRSAAETRPTGESTAGPESASSADPARPEERSATDAPSGGSDAEEAATEDVFEAEDQWRETTAIPSLAPDRTDRPGGATDSASGGDRPAGDRSESASRSRSSPRADSGPASASAGSESEASPTASRPESGASGEASSGGAGASDGTDGGLRDRVRELRTQLDQREEQVQRLKDRLSTLESERNEYKRERDALRQEVERLEAKLETGGSSGSGGGRRLDRSQAFDGTNLFVRYESKGQSTLAEAAAGEADPEDVNANLRLEHHTQFEAGDATVAGDPFEEFLTDSFEYRFVSWVVENLLYEIRDTGHRDGLRDLYDAIPRIDRVDLHGSVEVGSDDEEARRESFDVVMRDKMGNPLVVADLNGSRDPTTGEMMGSLVDAATGVGETHDELAGAFQVTESFFEPAALETAESATSGGFLSREKRESFVKLSRKRGYHLCLVESRSGGFHLNVPEL